MSKRLKTEWMIKVSSHVGCVVLNRARVRKARRQMIVPRSVAEVAEVALKTPNRNNSTSMSPRCHTSVISVN
jgi:hypothetical protein